MTKACLRLKTQLKDLPLGQSLHYFASVSSTMDAARELARNGAPHGTIVVAAKQLKGRGRMNRVWVSPKGGLYASFIVRPHRAIEEIPQLSLVAGLSVAEAIRDIAKLHPAIRWPNDLLLQDQKVCGILVEACHGAVIIGIGINVSTNPRELPPEAISLKACAAASTDIEALMVAVCRHLSAWYAVWSTSSFAPIREALRPWIGLFGRVVRVRAGTHQFEGTAVDLDEAGQLVIRLDFGLHRALAVGEVTFLR